MTSAFSAKPWEFNCPKYIFKWSKKYKSNVRLIFLNYASMKCWVVKNSKIFQEIIFFKRWGEKSQLEVNRLIIKFIQVQSEVQVAICCSLGEGGTWQGWQERTQPQAGSRPSHTHTLGDCSRHLLPANHISRNPSHLWTANEWLSTSATDWNPWGHSYMKKTSSRASWVWLTFRKISF